MRDIAFKALDAAPSKVGGVIGFALMGYATVWPDAAGRKLEAFMSPDSVQLWGGIGLAVVGAYWLLWFWLRPMDNAPTAASQQTTHGDGSPAIGTIHGNPTFNYGTAAPAAPIQDRKQAAPAHAERKAHIWSEDALSSLQRAMSGYRPRPDLPLEGVLVRVYKALGGMPQEKHRRDDFQRRVDLTIADAVVEHDLSVWGRLFDRPRERIGTATWRKGKFKHAWKYLEVQGDAVRPLRYTDLTFNKAEVLEVWPDE